MSSELGIPGLKNRGGKHLSNMGGRLFHGDIKIKKELISFIILCIIIF
jgi:hypothetical protein